MTDPNIGEQILKQLKILRWMTTVLAIVLIVAVVYVIVRLGEINTSLCTFRTDLETRAAGSQDYLDHPDKYPGIKIPEDVIRQQLDSQKKTIQSLSSLSC